MPGEWQGRNLLRLRLAALSLPLGRVGASCFALLDQGALVAVVFAAAANQTLALPFSVASILALAAKAVSGGRVTSEPGSSVSSMTLPHRSSRLPKPLSAPGLAEAVWSMQVGSIGERLDVTVERSLLE